MVDMEVYGKKMLLQLLMHQLHENTKYFNVALQRKRNVSQRVGAWKGSIKRVLWQHLKGCEVSFSIH